MLKHSLRRFAVARLTGSSGRLVAFVADILAAAASHFAARFAERARPTHRA